MGSAVTSFTTQHGLFAVFVLMAAESAGVPFPSEVIMPLAGALAAGAVAGVHLSLGWAIVLGAAGNLAGSLVAYALAALFGERLLLGPGRRVGFSARHLQLAQRWFDRYGLATVLVSRVLPVVRTYISFPAGLARVELVRFSVLTFVGALPWCAALAAGGYAIGANYDRISGPIEKVAIALAVVIVLLLAGWVVRGRRSATASGS
ncbi:MAG: DedA family protein [Chloroflexi bacterium]|nr:MAG: DedA family protein [Chloroflexota bacterium]